MLAGLASGLPMRPHCGEIWSGWVLGWLKIFITTDPILITTQYDSVRSTTQYYSVLLSTTQYCSTLLNTTQYYSALLNTTQYFSVLLNSPQWRNRRRRRRTRRRSSRRRRKRRRRRRGVGQRSTANESISNLIINKT